MTGIYSAVLLYHRQSTCTSEVTLIVICSARQCLPWKLAQILEGTRAKGSLEQTSMAGALAPMFPDDLTPHIDMSGKMWAHTVSVHNHKGKRPLVTCMVAVSGSSVNVLCCRNCSNPAHNPAIHPGMLVCVCLACTALQMIFVQA